MKNILFKSLIILMLSFALVQTSDAHYGYYRHSHPHGYYHYYQPRPYYASPPAYYYHPGWVRGHWFINHWGERIWVRQHWR